MYNYFASFVTSAKKPPTDEEIREQITLKTKDTLNNIKKLDMRTATVSQLLHTRGIPPENLNGLDTVDKLASLLLCGGLILLAETTSVNTNTILLQQVQIFMARLHGMLDILQDATGERKEQQKHVERWTKVLLDNFTDAKIMHIIRDTCISRADVCVMQVQQAQLFE